MAKPTQGWASDQYTGGVFEAADKMMAKLHNLVLFFPGSCLPPFLMFPNKNRQILTHIHSRVNFHFVTYSDKQSDIGAEEGKPVFVSRGPRHLEL